MGWSAYAQADARTGASPGPWWWRGLATPLSYVYGAVVAIRRWLYGTGLFTARTLPGKTISIGNLAAGGTGKSPVTALLAARLQAAGARPAILTRGYGSDLTATDCMALLAGEILMAPGHPSRPPDEGRMQSAALPNVPVVVGRRRYAAAQRFLSEHPDHAPTHWLLDDGLQHWQLSRDSDLVLLDARQLLPRLMPRGTGRERPTALRRADHILITRCGEGLPTPQQLHMLSSWTQAPIALTSMETALPELSADGRVPFELAAHNPVFLVSGVAQPEALLAAVSGLGLTVAAELRLADHSLIEKQELRAAAAASRAIVTTAKDYWRDPAVFADLPQPVFVLSLAVVGADAALDRVIKRLS